MDKTHNEMGTSSKWRNHPPWDESWFEWVRNVFVFCLRLKQHPNLQTTHQRSFLIPQPQSFAFSENQKPVMFHTFFVHNKPWTLPLVPANQIGAQERWRRDRYSHWHFYGDVQCPPPVVQEHRLFILKGDWACRTLGAGKEGFQIGQQFDIAILQLVRSRAAGQCWSQWLSEFVLKAKWGFLVGKSVQNHTISQSAASLGPCSLYKLCQWSLGVKQSEQQTHCNFVPRHKCRVLRHLWVPSFSRWPSPWSRPWHSPWVKPWHSPWWGHSLWGSLWARPWAKVSQYRWWRRNKCRHLGTPKFGWIFNDFQWFSWIHGDSRDVCMAHVRSKVSKTEATPMPFQPQPAAFLPMAQPGANGNSKGEQSLGQVEAVVDEISQISCVDITITWYNANTTGCKMGGSPCGQSRGHEFPKDRTKGNPGLPRSLNRFQPSQFLQSLIQYLGEFQQILDLA